MEQLASKLGPSKYFLIYYNNRQTFGLRMSWALIYAILHSLAVVCEGFISTEGDISIVRDSNIPNNYPLGCSNKYSGHLPGLKMELYSYNYVNPRHPDPQNPGKLNQLYDPNLLGTYECFDSSYKDINYPRVGYKSKTLIGRSDGVSGILNFNFVPPWGCMPQKGQLPPAYNFKSNITLSNFTMILFGYFKPKISGNHIFSLHGDDLIYLNFGAGNAFDCCRQESSADNFGNYQAFSLWGINWEKKTLTVYLDMNTYYPIRIFYNNRDYQAIFNFSFKTEFDSSPVIDFQDYFFFLRDIDGGCPGEVSFQTTCGNFPRTITKTADYEVVSSHPVQLPYTKTIYHVLVPCTSSVGATICTDGYYDPISNICHSYSSMIIKKLSSVLPSCSISSGLRLSSSSTFSSIPMPSVTTSKIMSSRIEAPFGPRIGTWDLEDKPEPASKQLGDSIVDINGMSRSHLAQFSVNLPSNDTQRPYSKRNSSFFPSNLSDREPATPTSWIYMETTVDPLVTSLSPQQENKTHQKQLSSPYFFASSVDRSLNSSYKSSSLYLDHILRSSFSSSMKLHQSRDYASEKQKLSFSEQQSSTSSKVLASKLKDMSDRSSTNYSIVRHATSHPNFSQIQRSQPKSKYSYLNSTESIDGIPTAHKFMSKLPELRSQFTNSPLFTKMGAIGNHSPQFVSEYSHYSSSMDNLSIGSDALESSNLSRSSIASNPVNSGYFTNDVFEITQLNNKTDSRSILYGDDTSTQTAISESTLASGISVPTLINITRNLVHVINVTAEELNWNTPPAVDKNDGSSNLITIKWFSDVSTLFSYVIGMADDQDNIYTTNCCGSCHHHYHNHSINLPTFTDFYSRVDTNNENSNLGIQTLNDTFNLISSLTHNGGSTFLKASISYLSLTELIIGVILLC